MASDTFYYATTGGIDFYIAPAPPAHTHSLEDLQKPQKKSKKDYPELYKACAKALDREEKEMSYDNNRSESCKRSSLERSIYRTMGTADEELSQHFGLRPKDHPKTAEEFQARLDAGQYTITKPDSTYDYPRLEWFDPKVKKDRDGYSKALEKLCAARDKAFLTASVADLPVALKAVEDFRDTDVSVYYS